MPNHYDDVMQEIRFTRSSEIYQWEIWNDVRANPTFHAGMLVVVWREDDKSSPYYGRVKRHIGFSEFLCVHKYEIEYIDSPIVECCVETQLERICGWTLSCVNGGLQ